MKRGKNYRQNESGSAIFYVLIAVALLGALIFAVSNGGRNNTSKLSEDRVRLIATEILEYSNALGNAVSQLRLRGASDTQISFENNMISGYTNANCADNICKIFHPEGGGVVYTPPLESALDPDAAAATAYANVGALLGEWYFPHDTCVDSVGLGGNNCYNDNTSITDLMVFLPWVNQSVCIEINDLLKVDNPSGVPPVVGGSMIRLTVDKFTGTYPSGAVHVYVDNDFVSEACVYHNSAPASPGLGYFYYKVLIAR